MVQLQFGLDTFGDVSTDDDGRPLSAAQTIRNLVEQAVLADELGVDAINVGEHHRNDFAVASPETVLAGIATRTKRITLGTGVTVLSSDDPVRVFQRFATVDALSSGRAEITAGRGSFTESFPLFGFSLADYDVLFDEKLDLLAALLAERPVTWHGTTRAPLVAQDVFPKTERGAIPLRVGVGGTPESVVRAARAGAQLALAIIGGDPARFAPFANLYRRALEDFGRQQLPVSVHSPGHIAETDDAAAEQLWPHYSEMYGRIGRERGWNPPSKQQFMAEIAYGSLYVGSPETVAVKIASAMRAVGADRFDFKYCTGPMPHALMMKSIELYATAVVPRVREILAD